MSFRNPHFAASARLNAAHNNSPPLRKGERHEAVALVQEAMIQLGYSMPVSTQQGARPLDGVFGDEMVRTTWKFQQAVHIQADGIVGHDTLAWLDALSSSGISPELEAAINVIVLGERLQTDRSIQTYLTPLLRAELFGSSLRPCGTVPGSTSSSAHREPAVTPSVDPAAIGVNHRPSFPLREVLGRASAHDRHRLRMQADESRPSHANMMEALQCQ